MSTENSTNEAQKVVVVNWFLGLAREMYLNARATMHRRVTSSELEKWSAFEMRLREIAAACNERYVGHDIVRKNGRVWYYNPAGFLLYVDANLGVLRRIPEMAMVVEAARVMEMSRQSRMSAWADGRLTAEQAEVRIRSVMEESYIQLKAAFD